MAQQKSNPTDMTASADQAQTWTAPNASGAAHSRATSPNLAAENHIVLSCLASSLRKETDVGIDETAETDIAPDIIAPDSLAPPDMLALLSGKLKPARNAPESPSEKSGRAAAKPRRELPPFLVR